jgi:D-tyrosyl-tRNA(Tyr) deacylase
VGRFAAGSITKTRLDRFPSCNFVTFVVMVLQTSPSPRVSTDPVNVSDHVRRVEFEAMRAIVQRVSRAQVSVDGEVRGTIQKGLLVLLGAGTTDSNADADYLANKIATLRIFEDPAGKMNLSVSEAGGAVLVVSQFTLFGDVRRGTRPSFDQAAPATTARELYEYFVKRLEERGLSVQTGRFQATMQVELVNDGPVTIMIDSRKTF